MPIKADSPLARRQQLHEERLKRIATPGMVKVFAATEAVRRLVKHPRGVAFRDNIGEAVEWPKDAFTTKRIADGTVYMEGGSAPREERRGEGGMGKRERIAARKPQAMGAGVGQPTPPPAPQAPAPASASEMPKQRPTSPNNK